MSDETTTSERMGFCQDCGKPLTKETARTVGTGMFCEPCLQVRLTNAASATQAAAPGYTANAGYIPSMPSTEKLPSPGLAGFLSIIPGVGQVYNGQYVKGIVILLICAVLDELGKTNHLGFFGLAAFAWWIFQIVDAYQTAKARVEGRPLPNPLELNDIGDKLGFGKGFGTSAGARAAAYGAAPVTPPPAPGTSDATAAAQASQTAPTTEWTPVNQNPVPVTSSGYAYAPPVNAPYVAPVPPAPYSTPLQNYPVPPVPPPSSSFPLVAIWLIGLGVLFAMAEWVPVWHVNGSLVTAIVLGAVAASILVRRLGYMGGINFHEPALHMLRGPIILSVLAVLFLLQGVHALTLGQTWPVILLAIGAVLLGERLGLGAQPYPLNYEAQAPASVVPPAAPTATTEAATQHNDERDGSTR